MRCSYVRCQVWRRLELVTQRGVPGLSRQTLASAGCAASATAPASLRPNWQEDPEVTEGSMSSRSLEAEQMGSGL